MSNMRNTLVLEAERNNKTYILVTPNEVNIGELMDVCGEFLAHCIKLIDDLKKEADKKKKEADETLSTIIATEKVDTNKK